MIYTPQWPDHIKEKARKALVIYGYGQSQGSEKFIMDGHGDDWHAFQVACIAAATEEELDKYLPDRNKDLPSSKKDPRNRRKYKLQKIQDDLVNKSREIIENNKL